MREWKRTAPFITDKRGVSEVVGAVLLFGILILALTTYQATVVPQQNAQTEFQHFEDVRDELIELRNAVSTAGQADVSQFPSVTLGTSYRMRTATINPPAPAGTLQTSDAYNITIENASGSRTNITTRFVTYQPGYHEITIGPTRYEHSVLYLDERERGNGVSIIEDQNIVKGGTVRITALQNQFQETATGRVTLELYPQEELSAGDFPESNGANLTVTVPTRLNESNYWDDALADANDIYQGVDSGSEVDKLNLSVNESDLELNTVGIREEPTEGPAKNTDPQSQTTSDSSDDSSENPSFDTVTVQASDVAGGSGNIKTVEASGSVTNSDSNGEIQMQLFSDDTRSTSEGQNEIQMSSSFTITTDTNTNQPEVYVDIRLLNPSGGIYEECKSDTGVTESNSLDLSDFSC